MKEFLISIILIVLFFSLDSNVYSLEAPHQPLLISATVSDSGGGGGGGGGGSSSSQPEVTQNICKGADFNKDNKVNSIDFSILLAFWKTNPPFSNSCVDINKDNKVNSVDFSILLSQWGTSGIIFKNN